jgi:acyl-CoA reductase-like NAD-dependent aldehyde dehydrogenase
MISADASRVIGPEEATRIGRSLVAGQPLENGRERIHRAPFDAGLEGPIVDATEADVPGVISMAEAGARAARALPLHARVAIVERLAELVTRDGERLAATMTWQTGKPIRETRREVVRTVDTLRLSARAADLLGGEQILTDTTPGGMSLWAFTHRRPIGVVAAITPFNAPLNLLAHKLGPSIVGGNATIVKPASAAPLTAVQLVELAIEAGCPPEMVSVLVGPAAVGLALAAAPGVGAITFTGGRHAAEEIWRAAPLKRVVMELGGNSANVIFDDADLELAADECVRGSFSNSGQSCNSVQRIIAPAHVAAELAELLDSRIARLKVGDPFDADTDIGSMVSDVASTRVCAWLDEAVASGAAIATGGSRTGATLSPTLVTGARPGMRIVDDEVFGPVAVMVEHRGDDDAIELANATPYGLQFGVFTRSLDRAFRSISLLESGSVIINRSSNYRLDAFIYGGVKQSGVGREDPRSTLRELTEEHFAVLGDRA